MSKFHHRFHHNRRPKNNGGENRHPSLAERGPRPVPPLPEAELPVVYAANVFGKLDRRLQYAVADAGYAVPTPIQEQSVVPLLEGRDMIGCAQTGTGKTAAFLLPILDKILKMPDSAFHAGHPKALILSPTRELAAQTAENHITYCKYCGIPMAVVFGGVGQGPQVKAISSGASVVIATPGRLIDLMTQGVVYLDQVEMFVLDEADRMLDMGFLPDIKRIISKLPASRQSLFFSATLSPEIMNLAGELVHDPVQVTIKAEHPTVDRINQKVMFVDKGNKDALLVHLLQNHPEWTKVIVFARMRHQADRITRKLQHAEIKVAAIHSDKTQNQRTQALQGFRDGRVRVLVATDIASRGIDVPDVSCVVNVELPKELESYVHRIGRTARAGESGCAISFVGPEERGTLKAVERFIKMTIQPDRDHPFHCEAAEKNTGKQNQGLPTAPWVKAQRNAGRGNPFQDELEGQRGNGGGRPHGKPGGGIWQKKHAKKFIHPANAKQHHRQRSNFQGRKQADFGQSGDGI